MVDRRRPLVAVVFLVCFSSTARAQAVPPVVTITPTSVVVVGGTTVNVTIDWCGYDPTWYDPGTRVIRLNGVDVSAQFTTQWTFPNSCSIEPEPADDIYERSTGTITLVPGSNTLYAEIRSFDNYVGADQETYVTPPPDRNVVVTSNLQYVPVRPGSTGNARVFTIWNTGTAQDTFSLATVCSGAASGCSVVPGSLQLAAAATGTATVTHAADTTPGSTGLVWLKAWKTSNPAIRDSSWTEVTVTSPPPAGAVLVSTGAVLERNLCVTIAAAAGAASECGDLRLAHALPAIRTRGQARVPTLVYSSQHASPYPLVAADVTLPTGIPTPDSVTAKLRIGGVLFAQGKWLGSQWQSGWASRIVVAFATDTTTGIYSYTLEVTRWKTGVGTNVATPAGELVVVNRRTSPFGAGWWLAGLEQLNVGTKVWVGGDGSVRRYTAAGTNTWVAPNVDRPDSMKWDGTHYIRYLRNGLKVKLNAQGRHVETVTRLSQTTRFTYDGSGRVDSLLLPPAGSGKFYRFRYNASTARLDSVIAPPIGATGRATKLTLSGTRVTTIRDPDLSTVTLAYGTGADSNRVVRRTNRRGYATHFRYDTGKRLTRDSLPLTTGFIAKTYLPSETRGIAGSAAWRADTVYTALDGPRSDVSDVTKFWVNAYGAPTRIRNAVGRETRIVYDATWPALAARTVAPNFFETKAFYNPRGLTDFTIGINPLGTGANDTSKYKWHATWDMVVSARSPLGLLDTMAYDGPTGNRLWQQRGTDMARRVNFTYYGSGASNGLLATIVAPLTPAESYFYNSLGNLSKTQSPIGFVNLVYSDAIGRDTLVRSPIDSATGRDSASVIATGTWARTIYDVVDRVTSATTWGPTRAGVNGTNWLADSVRVEHQYDAEGNVTSLWRRYRIDGSPWTLQSTSSFDRANRVEWAFSPSGGTTTYTYDPASNVTATLTPRGQTITTSYDALNRVTQRFVPAVTYLGTPCWAFIPIQTGCFFSFPTRGGPDVCLRADTATFTYDHAGNMVRADNWAARVRRSYTPSGLLKTDTLRTRTYYYALGQPCEPPPPSGAIASWDWHVYPLQVDYDLEARRTKLWHPAAVSPCTTYPPCGQSYWYGTQTGLLDSIADIRGNKVKFTSDAAGRRVLTRWPGNWKDTVTYDADSRIPLRQVTSTSSPDGIVDQVSYDALGRARSASDAWGYTIGTYYSGLGAVIGTSGMTGFDASTEEFKVDGLANRIWRRQLGMRPTHPDVDGIRLLEHDGVGRLSVMRDTVGQGAPFDPYLYRQDHSYDGAGNEGAVWSAETDYTGGGGTLYDQAVSYYRADQTLAVFNRHLGISGISDDNRPGQRGVYEEYRTDALGRRVLKRSRHDSACSVSDAECASVVERTIWEGDQVLYEIRSPGSDSTAVSLLEDDAATGGSAQAYAFGRVTYTHAGGIDQPLGIIRVGMVQQPDPWVLFPHANWRGSFEGGSHVDGTTCWSGPGCIIPWPGRGTTADGQIAQPIALLSWFGNLVVGKTDGSGLQYLRNRYYDPRTGRFTQEDPIGLAGGLNLYGFAAGDPVNFSDPFGLQGCLAAKGCPPSELASMMVEWAMTQLADAAKAGINLLQSIPVVGPWLRATSGVGRDGETLSTGERLGALAGFAADASAVRSAASGIRLAKSLASQAQMAEAGTVLAGGQTGTAFRDAARYAQRYGGEAVDWVKKTSSTYRAADGTAFQTHWVENLVTGMRVASKTKLVQ